MAQEGNIAWIMACSALVLFMTPGLALFYAGLARSKNAAGTIMHSLMSMGIVGVVWVLWGYTIAFGPSIGGIFGDLSLFGLSGVEVEPSGDGIPEMLFMIFQGMFAIIAPAILTGAFAERMKFSAYVLFMILWVTIVYAPVAHWVWAEGGWILSLGALDFAGGNVVHITSGVGALAAALIVGKRLGFGMEPMESHNVPMVVMGAGMLWFGWFGFNAGSALEANGTAINAFVVTNTAAAAGVLGWTAVSWIKDGKPSVIGAASGAVAGLVAITPAAGFVGPLPAIIIGFIGGALCDLAARFLIKMNLDDALSVWGVHGVGGTWGGIATALFVGIGFGVIGDFTDLTRIQQLGIQALSIVATWAWAFVATAGILLALKYTIGLRVSDNGEAIGLDLSEHDEPAYRWQ